MDSFQSTSTEKPALLNVSFRDDPGGSLGAVLLNCDKFSDHEMFLPGYAVVSRLLDGDTVARRKGVKPGDCIIAVNGQGFRRFAADYSEGDVQHLNDDSDQVTTELDHRVVPAGAAYDDLLKQIKAVKVSRGQPGSPGPLLLSLERYGWDARPNSWPRFLAARDAKVPDAMQMIQDHERWKSEYFPISLTTSGLQRILHEKVVSEIDANTFDGSGEDDGDEATNENSNDESNDKDKKAVTSEKIPPTVYVNYARLLALQTQGLTTADDVVAAFVIFTERMLAAAPDPRHPKACQMIDLSGCSITTGFRTESLKKIYQVFEPNYPETLAKMVIYPVSTMLAKTASTLLSFVNERTREKFCITSSLDTVCEELGWSKAEVESLGGIQEFMQKHEKAGTSMLRDVQVEEVLDVVRQSLKVEDLLPEDGASGHGNANGFGSDNPALHGVHGANNAMSLHEQAADMAADLLAEAGGHNDHDHGKEEVC